MIRVPGPHRHATPGLHGHPTPAPMEHCAHRRNQLRHIVLKKRLPTWLLMVSVSVLVVFSTPARAQSSLLNYELQSHGNFFVVTQQVTDFSGSKCTATGTSRIKFRVSGSVRSYPTGDGTILGSFTAKGTVEIGPQNVTVPNRPPNSGVVQSFRETFHVRLNTGEHINGTKSLSPVIPDGVLGGMTFAGYPGNFGHCRDNPLGPTSYGFALVNEYRAATRRSGIGFTQTFPIFDAADVILDTGFRENFLSEAAPRLVR